VLHNAVAGIAEIINFPGMVNVDFEDVRTVMAEMGMAMMGSASAAGIDRARLAAEQAVASPLLEGINLSGARGVLVNITASRSLKMKEVNEVMNTIREFAAEDATIIFGAVFDEAGSDDLRVTVVATGLGKVRPPLTVVPQKTGTDNLPVSGTSPNHKDLDIPTVFRNNRAGTLEALQQSGMEHLDIPAFLRKQAD
jgi:cell division protein FtsZ